MLLWWRQDGLALTLLLIELTSPCDVLTLFNYESLMIITADYFTVMIDQYRHSLNSFVKLTCSKPINHISSELMSHPSWVPRPVRLKTNRGIDSLYLYMYHDLI